MDSDMWLKRPGARPEDTSAEAIKSMDAKELEEEIQREAELVFRSSALKVISESSDDYGVLTAFSSVPKPSTDLEGLGDDMLYTSTVTPEIQPLRDPETGEVKGFYEIYPDHDDDAGDSRTSMSLNR
ncbi:unnamed protein product [Gongylonema pulchrum]|uniref:Transmembrane protein 169 n=1 Tax=Gongylonema pulchrum TaxID=637853 RepID=A0A183DHU1_9BILA|nr:unnamed protein product [Gongylonema pulchrum]